MQISRRFIVCGSLGQKGDSLLFDGLFILSCIFFEFAAGVDSWLVNLGNSVGVCFWAKLLMRARLTL